MSEAPSPPGSQAAAGCFYGCWLVLGVGLFVAVAAWVAFR
jgi:uncharacterized membrane protein